MAKWHPEEPHRPDLVDAPVFYPSEEVSTVPSFVDKILVLDISLFMAFLNSLCMLFNLLSCSRSLKIP